MQRTSNGQSWNLACINVDEHENFTAGGLIFRMCISDYILQLVKLLASLYPAWDLADNMLFSYNIYLFI